MSREINLVVCGKHGNVDVTVKDTATVGCVQEAIKANGFPSGKLWYGSPHNTLANHIWLAEYNINDGCILGFTPGPDAEPADAPGSDARPDAPRMSKDLQAGTVVGIDPLSAPVVPTPNPAPRKKGRLDDVTDPGQFLLPSAPGTPFVTAVSALKASVAKENARSPIHTCIE